MRLPMQVYFPIVLCNRRGLVRLVIVLIGLVVNDVEELELVDTLGGGDDTEPVTELLLLEELLGPGEI